jgi:predicted HicB family RNase H-like nuclease
MQNEIMNNNRKIILINEVLHRILKTQAAQQGRSLKYLVESYLEDKARTATRK